MDFSTKYITDYVLQRYGLPVDQSTFQPYSFNSVQSSAQWPVERSSYVLGDYIYFGFFTANFANRTTVSSMALLSGHFVGSSWQLGITNQAHSDNGVIEGGERTSVMNLDPGDPVQFAGTTVQTQPGYVTQLLISPIFSIPVVFDSFDADLINLDMFSFVGYRIKPLVV